MVHLYISESATRISVTDNRIVITPVALDDPPESHPIETVDAIVIFGRPSMTTPFISEMLRRQVEIQMFTTDGKYVGRICTPNVTYAPRLRSQVHASENPQFALAIAKRITTAKIRNQMGLVKAHASDKPDIDVAGSLTAMQHSLDWVNSAGTLAETNGFEGNAAKAYFAALSLIVPSNWAFSGRSTRPPKDAFNSMISLGYSLLYKNTIGAIERNGLNAYIGFMHQDSRNHATLASDMMEPWRAPIVDDAVLRLIAEDAVSIDDFTTDDRTRGAYVARETTRALTRVFGHRIARPTAYLVDDTRRYTFQVALDLQLQSLSRAVEDGDPDLFIGMDSSSLSDENQ